MSKLRHIHLRYSPRLALGVLLAVLGFQPLVSELSAAPSARVVAVQPGRVADLIILGSGFNAGLRQGMVCRVTRDNAAIAEVLLVELRPTCSAALILNLAAQQSIHAGDFASIKILKS